MQCGPHNKTPTLTHPPLAVLLLVPFCCVGHTTKRQAPNTPSSYLHQQQHQQQQWLRCHRPTRPQRTTRRLRAPLPQLRPLRGPGAAIRAVLGASARPDAHYYRYSLAATTTREAPAAPWQQTRSWRRTRQNLSQAAKRGKRCQTMSGRVGGDGGRPADASGIGSKNGKRPWERWSVLEREREMECAHERERT